MADIITKQLYKEGVDSNYVHKYVHGHHFHHKSEVEEDKKYLQNEIITHTRKCGRSLFIIDEIEKISPCVLDVLKPYIEHHERIDGIDYRKNIFIFLSNIAGDAISKETLNHFKTGKAREDITLKQMEKIIKRYSFNLNGGFKYSSLISGAVVDFFLPFLPMEKDHVKECVRAGFRKRNLRIDNSIVNQVADERDYFPEKEQLFSKTGCKQIEKKLDGFGSKDEL